MVRSVSFVSMMALLVLATAPSAHAKCGDYAETLLTTELVGPDPRIVMEVYAFDDASLAAARFELVGSRGTRVPLTVIATHDGMHQRQFELAPNVPLAAGAWTVRRIDSPRPGAHALTVAAPEATLAAPPRPVLHARASERQEFGCGPGEHLLFDLTGDASLAYVMLVDTKTDKIETGFVPVGNGTFGARELAVGHGMCSGEFELAQGTTYRLAVELVGADGRRGPGATTSATYSP